MDVLVVQGGVPDLLLGSVPASQGSVLFAWRPSLRKLDLLVVDVEPDAVGG